ncbi:hypothetical protein [Priestia megaterium]|uniref:hypothetical protein n=1 Tax=Priestia megaterium TaxID=1404 RepID=UPI000CA0E4D9|nr:hypothetical protein [Priestia megaterium]AUO14812.1 hypothetical protein C0569_26375 [Priestia megaterium]
MTANQILLCIIVEVVVLSIFISLMIYSVKQHNKKVKELYAEHNKKMEEMYARHNREVQELYNKKNKIMWKEYSNKINNYRESLGLPREKF